MSQRAFQDRFASRPEKKARREAIDAQFEEGSKRDEQAWEDGFMETTASRPVFAPLSVSQQKALDEILTNAGARRLLGTLAQLCEARAPSEYDLDTDFSDHDDAELWTARANELYAVMERVK
jgi:hypothetical protein